jgi:hypothetical protein
MAYHIKKKTTQIRITGGLSMRNLLLLKETLYSKKMIAALRLQYMAGLLPNNYGKVMPALLKQ